MKISNFPKFYKNQKMPEIVQMAHKRFENFQLKKNWFCALFRQFPAFLEFSKISIFFPQIIPTPSLSELVSAKTVCASQSHPDLVCLSPSLCLTRCLPLSQLDSFPASPGVCMTRSVEPGLCRDDTAEVE